MAGSKAYLINEYIKTWAGLMKQQEWYGRRDEKDGAGLMQQKDRYGRRDEKDVKTRLSPW